MGKASSNAGQHPYWKDDFISPIKKHEHEGLPLSPKPIIFMDSFVKTEYKDSNKKDLYHRDEVKYENEKYRIEYDSKDFRWILSNGNKTIALKEVYKKTVLVRKCKAREKH